MCHMYHAPVSPANVCKECDKLALLSEEGWRKGGVQRIHLPGVGTDIVTQLVVEGHHLLKLGVVALCQVLCVCIGDTPNKVGRLSSENLRGVSAMPTSIVAGMRSAGEGMFQWSLNMAMAVERNRWPHISRSRFTTASVWMVGGCVFVDGTHEHVCVWMVCVWMVRMCMCVCVWGGGGGG